MKRIMKNSLVFVVLAQAMVAINITSSKYLVSHIAIIPLLQIRFAIGTMILFVFLLGKQPKKMIQHLNRMNKKQWALIFAQAICAGALFNLLMLFGLHFTTASIAGVITSALPAVIIIFSVILLKERLSLNKTLCLIFATIGLLVINIRGVTLSGHGLMGLFGDLIILLALIPEGLYYVFNKMKTKRLPPILLAFILNLINAIVIIPFLFISPAIHMHFSLLEINVLLVSGLSSALFYLFWIIGSANLDGATSGLMTTLMPIFTILLSWICLGSGIGFIQAIGMLFIIGSIIISSRHRSDKPSQV